MLTRKIPPTRTPVVNTPKQVDNRELKPVQRGDGGHEYNELAENSQNYQHMQQGFTVSSSMDDEDNLCEAGDYVLNTHSARFVESRMVCSDQDLQELLPSEQAAIHSPRTYCIPVLSETQIASKVTAPIENSFADQDEVEDMYNGTKLSDSSESPVGSNNSMLQLLGASTVVKGSATEKAAGLQCKRRPSSAFSIRPYRSRRSKSCIEVFSDTFSDRGSKFEDSNEADMHARPIIGHESEVAEEMNSDADQYEMSVNSDGNTTEEAIPEKIDHMEDDEPIEPSKKPHKQQKKTVDSSQRREGKGINLNLPPLDDINSIFADMASNAMKLGLSKALENLGDRPINIATMCSGTESPLLAIDLLSKG